MSDREPSAVREGCLSASLKMALERLESLPDLSEEQSGRHSIQDRSKPPWPGREIEAIGDTSHACNRQIREALFGPTDDRLTARRQAARVTRLFNRLHAHDYIAKIPHTRRWRVSDLGRAAMSAVLEVRENAFPAAFAKAAA